MIDRAAAGGAPDDMDLVGLYLLDKAPPRQLFIFHTLPKKSVYFYRLSFPQLYFHPHVRRLS